MGGSLEDDAHVSVHVNVTGETLKTFDATKQDEGVASCCCDRGGRGGGAMGEQTIQGLLQSVIKFSKRAEISGRNFGGGRSEGWGEERQWVWVWVWKG